MEQRLHFKHLCKRRLAELNATQRAQEEKHGKKAGWIKNRLRTNPHATTIHEMARVLECDVSYFYQDIHS